MGGPLNIQALLQEAIGLHNAGRLAEAEKLYRQILALDHRNVNAMNLLGVLAAQVGKFADALTLLHAALELAPGAAEIHLNLGNALTQAHRPAEAVPAFRKALELRPGYPRAVTNLGIALAQAGEIAEAAMVLEKATTLTPNDLSALQTLGVVLDRLGRYPQAIAVTQRALASCKDSPADWPGRAVILCNLSHALWRQGRIHDAAKAAQDSIAIRPDLAPAHQNLVLALADLGRVDEAMVAADRAAALAEDQADIHNDRANVLKAAGRLDEALAAYRRALAIEPTHGAANSNFLYTLYFHPGSTGAAILQEHRAWAERCAASLVPAAPQYGNRREAGRRLRVGYVSPDFRDHCQAFFTLPLLSHHDHQGFEIFCYSSVTQADAVTERIRSQADVWREVAELSDEKLAAMVRTDGIDILVDLTMHMERGRPGLFARRPAPVQIAWLAYPGTTGNPGIGYRLTDPQLDPPANDGDYSEISLRLPETFWCYDPLTEGPGVNELPAIGAGQVMFGCLNNFCKITGPTLALWRRALAAVPRSRFIVMAPLGSVRDKLVGELGVAAERVTFVERQERLKYLAEYNRIDLALDTFPYNGHTTSLDAYWMGVPVVTMAGSTAVSRAGLSQLTNLGMTELVAKSADEFVAIAAGLAGDLGRLATVRRGLRGRMRESALMDGGRFARGVEAAYREAWERGVRRGDGS